MTENIFAPMARGSIGKCPKCGKGKLFNGYLQLSEHCNNCNDVLGNLPTRDTPAQISMFLILAIIVPLILTIEAAYDPPFLFHLWFSVPLIIFISLVILRITKGAIAGILWFLKLKD